MEIMYPRGSGRYPILVPTIVVHKGFEYELCKCLEINVGRIIFDEFEYESEMELFCHWMLRKQLNKPLDYTGGLKMHNNKEELLKDVLKRRAIDEMVIDPLAPNSIELLNVEIENSVRRKKRLMRLEKEHLVDMVFNLESRNETLVNNLSEVERMYNKLKEEK